MTRNVVISGGGTGIGLAAAQVFAADGDQVLLLDGAGTYWSGEGAGALTYAADLADPEAVRGVAGFVGREFGAVDVLIHCAAATDSSNPPSAATTPSTRSPVTGRSTSASMR
ncbi:hypothetical protein GCM10023238_12520 [Streptomyces heliomycini]